MQTSVQAQKELYLCVTRGDVPGIEAALQDGAEINGTWSDRDGTPLAGAIVYKYCGMAQYLVALGGDPCPYADQLLALSAEGPPDGRQGRHEFAKDLLALGANPNYRFAADPQRAHRHGRTVLFDAAHDANLPLIRLLLLYGADPCLFDAAGNSPLHIAAEVGSSRTVDLLVSAGGDVDGTRRNDCRTPLHNAADHVFFYDEEQSYDTTRSKAGVVSTLIRNGANIAAKDECGLTSLHYAAWSMDDDPAALAELISAGANVEALDDYGNTPIHLAALSGRLNTASALIKAGARVDRANKWGDTPWSNAIIRQFIGTDEEPMDFSLLSLLLQNGAQINSVNPEGDTALHYACEKGSLTAVQFLVGAGANMTVLNKHGQLPSMVARCHEHPAIASWLENVRS